MQLKDLVGAKITEVEPLFHTSGTVTAAIRIEGLAEPVSIEVEETCFENLRGVSFLEVDEDEF